MPEPGNYLLAGAGFSIDKLPFITLQSEGTFYDLNPFDKTLTLAFDMSGRYCTGWRDITTGERHTCPEQKEVAEKYEECPACQKRTGFNPAFYHAASVSVQQEARNNEPHFLYLAHFGPGVIKVGISYAARNQSRLLEQGARSALVLDTFPSAHIARQYEAKIASAPDIAETVPLRKKVAQLSRTYDQGEAAKELEIARIKAEQMTGVGFAGTDIVFLDPLFFPGGIPDTAAAHDCSDQHAVSGRVTGMLGTLLLCRNDTADVFLPLKKYTGYRVILSYDETPLTLPARQISLF